MHRQIRRRSQQLSEAECRDILKQSEYGTLATVGSDGYPYAVPLNHLYDGEAIYFHCANNGHKLENIAACPKVSFNTAIGIHVTTKISNAASGKPPRFRGFNTAYRSVTVSGKAAAVEGHEKQEILELFLKRFLSPDDLSTYEADGLAYIRQLFEMTTVVKIDIETMTGKRGIPLKT